MKCIESHVTVLNGTTEYRYLYLLVFSTKLPAPVLTDQSFVLVWLPTMHLIENYDKSKYRKCWTWVFNTQ